MGACCPAAVQLPGQAEDFHGADREPARHVDGEELGERGFHVRHLPVGLQGEHAVGEHPRDLDLDGGLGEAVAHVGAVDQTLAEAGGLRAVGDEVVEVALRAGGAGDVGALEVEGGGGDVPAAVELAEDGVLGDADVVEVDLVEALAVVGLADGLDGDAGRLHREEEVGDAAVLGGLGVGAGEEVDVLGEVGAGGPDLLAVDDELVAVDLGAGLEGGEVGAGVGLGEALAPDVLRGGDAGKVALLLLLGAVDDERGAELVGLSVEHGGAPVGELFLENGLLDEGLAEAAVLLGPRDADPAAGAELLAELQGVGPVLCGKAALAAPAVAELFGRLGVNELADLGPERIFLWGETELHA